MKTHSFSKGGLCSTKKGQTFKAHGFSRGYLQTGADVMYFSITKLASAAAVREATVLRFCGKVGCTGYQEFKLVLTKEASEDVTPVEGENLVQLRLNRFLETLYNSINMLDYGGLQ